MNSVEPNWEPSRGDHSIERAVVQFALREPLDDDTFDDLVVRGRRAANAHGFTSRTDMQELPEMPQGAVFVSNITPIRRVSFRQLAAGQDSPNEVIVFEFAMSANRFSFHNFRYRRWNDFTAVIIDILDSINYGRKITECFKSIRLEYLDKFKSGSEGGNHYEVLRNSTRYLPSAVVEKTESFHAHCGWFDFEGESIRRLTNVNIDVRDAQAGEPEGTRSIFILTLAQLDDLSNVLPTPFPLLENLHTYLKKIFGEIITVDAAARVALND